MATVRVDVVIEPDAEAKLTAIAALADRLEAAIVKLTELKITSSNDGPRSPT